MDANPLFTNFDLMSAWLVGLILSLMLSFAFNAWATKLEKVRCIGFTLMIFPAILITPMLAWRRFGDFDRPLVHWIFEKNAHEALRLGIGFDSISFAVSIFFAIALMAISFRTKPSIGVSAALVHSWVGLSLAATSQTLWMAVLGMGIQILSRIFPLMNSSDFPETSDARWVVGTKRGWIGTLFVLCGGCGLATLGVHLDFFSGTNWSALEASAPSLIAGGLLISGLLMIAAPAFSSHTLYEKNAESTDFIGFITENALSWISVIMIYRLFGNIHDSIWLQVIGFIAAAMVIASLITIPFQTVKHGAIHLWLGTLPVASLLILPLVPAHDASLYLIGSIVAFCGLWISFDHGGKLIDKVGSAVFFLAATGFIGWSTSAGLLTYFSRAESDPVFIGITAFLLFVFGTLGWRILLSAGNESIRPFAGVKWAALALLFLLGFGPVVSGRWSGGAIPLDVDWIEGAKSWPWVRLAEAERPDANWLGFGLAQSISVLSLLFGSLLWRGAEIFPFAKRYPGGARFAQGLFGMVGLSEFLGRSFKATGEFFSREFSARIWEQVIPRTVEFVFTGFRRLGATAERWTDYFTRESYGKIFRSPAKLTQWFQGGNARLYAWFALMWIFVFALYLNR